MSMHADNIGKWASGTSYGPVLPQTDLYMLKPELTIHPTMAGANSKFTLIFNIATGQSGGFNADSRDQDLPFEGKDEPATLPRVAELYIITVYSPWCTVVRNERGVTMQDVCTALYKDYTENFVTDPELAAVPPRLQENIKRAAATLNNNYGGGGYGGWGGAGMHTPAGSMGIGQLRRVDWLREHIFFENLKRDERYVTSRLGYHAPNIFVMTLGT